MDVTLDGTDVLHQTFSSGTGIGQFFAHRAIDLGPLSGSTLNLGVSLTVTLDSPYTGFHAGFLVGG